VARFSLSAVGVDQPGIVSAVSGVLVDKGCNLEDSAMTILQGWFAILLVVSAPDRLSLEELESELSSAARRFDLVVSVRRLGEDPGLHVTASGDPWTISIHGADRPGLVHGITKALADAGGNIVDLSTHLVGSAQSPVYVMTLRAMLPAGEPGEQTASAVRSAAARMGVHCTLHRDESEVI